jgi:hypothetical protein
MHSSDDSIRSGQHVWRNREADLLGGFEIDNELELRRLLDRQVGWLSAFQNFVYEYGGTFIEILRFVPYDIKPPASTNSRSS